MTDQTHDTALHEARVALLGRMASVSRNNGADYDAHAFLAARAVFGDMVTVESWRSWGGTARRSMLDTIEPGRGWFTPLDRQREQADLLRENIRTYRSSAQSYRTQAETYRAEGRGGYARDYDGYATTHDQEADRFQRQLDEMITANPLLADPSDKKDDPVPLPPEQATTEADEDEEDEHEHGVDEDGDNPTCEGCGGYPDGYCEHDHDCRSCDQCEHEHDCRHCGLDPDCEHRFTYTCSCGESGVEYDG